MFIAGICGVRVRSPSCRLARTRLDIHSAISDSSHPTACSVSFTRAGNLFLDSSSYTTDLHSPVRSQTCRSRKIVGCGAAAGDSEHSIAAPVVREAARRFVTDFSMGERATRRMQLFRAFFLRNSEVDRARLTQIDEVDRDSPPRLASSRDAFQAASTCRTRAEFHFRFDD